MPQRPQPLAALRGSIPPLITPFTRGAVDYDRYTELVEFQIAEGSHGILVNGTTAEPSSLTTDERNRLVTLAVAAARGRVPVVGATGSQSLAETRVLTEHAVAGGGRTGCRAASPPRSESHDTGRPRSLVLGPSSSGGR